MSKAAKIRILLGQGISTAEIAEWVKVDPAYVRAVKQRTDKDGNPTPTEADKRWQATDECKAAMRERARDWRIQNRKRALLSNRRWYWTNRASHNRFDPIEYRKS